ncbi:MAG: hypothetical protein LBN39_09985 [Planctomycetaceae bacterium]|jgi:pimeloyl-ACP methyl ester carboxylesterase|nr:hypothetical protein [Planctomycetaceae bacterium]
MKPSAPLSVLICFFAITAPLSAAKYVLKDGRTVEGKHAQIAKVDEKAEDVGKSKIRLITVIDDGLRYLYVSKYNINAADDAAEMLETFKTQLYYTRDGKQVSVLGEFDNSTPFDPFGRRLLTVHHYGGTEFFSQAITELNPKYIRARAIHLNNNPVVWDMRLAANSLPREQLTPILMNQIDPKNLEDRLRLVRFYIQGKLLEDAAAELYGILDDWKDDTDVKQRLSGVFRMVEQQRYQRRLDELELRWKAGQFVLVKQLLNETAADKNLPEQLFMSVRRMLQRYDDFDKQRTEIISRLQSLYEKLPPEQKDERILPILDEIEKGLSLNNVERFAAFLLSVKDEKMPDTEKLAAGITGWFAGSNADNRRLSIAATLPDVRKDIIEYLQSGSGNVQRQEILKRLRSLEAARPELVAKVLAYIKPPPLTDFNPQAAQMPPLTVSNPIAGTVDKIHYLIQLPPEYDADKRYPVIVALNGAAQTPEMMLDWWGGTLRGKERFGHATRNGYIVVAPDWNPKEIKKLDYDFSALSHAAVLLSLKDVFRRFSVDTDKVFITGHGIGGTAAWDIALAHPDLWAGAVPFNAVASKYINAYRDNAQYVPLYLVWGELEGFNNQNKWTLNASILNRYLAVQHQPPDVTVVRYIGRGAEGFSDEIVNIFDWMKLRSRNFTPLEFTTDTLRAWDSFFWGVEMSGIEKEKPEFLRDPLYWSADSSLPKNMLSVSAKLIRQTNRVQIDTAPKISGITVFLTPEMLDFGTKTVIMVNNKPYQPANGLVEPDIGVILEDARTRCDRLHPFWIMLDGTRTKR